MAAQAATTVALAAPVVPALQVVAMAVGLVVMAGTEAMAATAKRTVLKTKPQA